jgi:hypothetical protein
MAITLNRTDLDSYIRDLPLSDLDRRITRNGERFDVEELRTGPFVCDVGSLWEEPEGLGEHGKRAGTAGPFTVYEYHDSYTAPHTANFEQELDALTRGEVEAVIVGYGALDATWLFGIRTEAVNR